MLRKLLSTLCLVCLLITITLLCLSYFNLFYAKPRVWRPRVSLSRGAITWHQATIWASYDLFNVSPSTIGNLEEYLQELEDQAPEWTCVGFRDFETIFWPLHDPASAELHLPLWIPLLLFGTTYFFRETLPHLRLRFRRSGGLCERCGYDLRGSKGRCPECGQEFISTPVAR